MAASDGATVLRDKAGALALLPAPKKRKPGN
jgi:hypothetical protein